MHGTRKYGNETALSTEDNNEEAAPTTRNPVKQTPKKSMDINVAHDKFGHTSEAALRATLKSIGIETSGALQPCEGCALAKAKSKAVPKVATNKATMAGERLGADISGPYKKSIVGSTYWILVVDEYSGKSWSFFVKKKSQMAATVEPLLLKLRNANYVIRYL